MDIDALAKDFYRFKPMLEDMLVNWNDWKAEHARLDRDFPHLGGSTGLAISPELHAEIHAPLHDSEDQIAAKQSHALETANAEADAAKNGFGEAQPNGAPLTGLTAQDEMLDRLAYLGPDKVRELLANGALPAAWHSPATLWLAEKDGAKVATDATAPGQNQGQSEPNGSEGGNPPENVGQALPEPSLGEQNPAPTADQVATDQGTMAKPVA